MLWNLHSKLDPLLIIGDVDPLFTSLLLLFLPGEYVE